MKDDTYRSQFRLPYELYEQLKKSSKDNHRSLNAEIVDRLQESLEPAEARTVKLDEETRRELLTQLLAEFAEEGLRRMLEERDGK